MRVLVTGGTGFIGGRCVASLQEAGYAVRVLARSPEKAAPVSAAGVEVLTGDFLDPHALQRATAGMDAVVHCVGIITEPRGVTFERTVAEGTRRLVDACVESGVRRLVYLSATGVRPNAVSRYHLTKWGAEEAIRASGIGYTILRASLVYGRHDHFLNFLLKFPVIVLPGGGEMRFQPLYVEDLAALVTRSLITPAAENRTFDAAGPDVLTYREMMRCAVRIRGKRRLFLPVPMPLMHLLAFLCDPFQRIYPPLALLTRDQYRMLQEDSTGDLTALREIFPDLRLHGFAEGMAASVPTA